MYHPSGMAKFKFYVYGEERIRNPTTLNNLMHIALDTLDNMWRNTDISNYEKFGITKEELELGAEEKFKRGLPYWSPYLGPGDEEVRTVLMREAKDLYHPCWYIMNYGCINYSITNYFIMMELYPTLSWYIIALKAKTKSDTENIWSRPKIAHVFVANQDHLAVEAGLSAGLGLGTAAAVRASGQLNSSDLIIVDPCEWVLNNLAVISQYEMVTYNLYNFMRYGPLL
jgi:hypothetical protein